MPWVRFKCDHNGFAAFHFRFGNQLVQNHPVAKMNPVKCSDCYYRSVERGQLRYILVEIH